MFRSYQEAARVLVFWMLAAVVVYLWLALAGRIGLEVSRWLP